MTLLLVSVLSFACGGSDDGGVRLKPTHQVTVGAVEFDVELAVTPAKRSTGLGNRAPLAPNEGMFFVFPEPARETFWMKDVSYPLDFVWISPEREVIEVTASVPPDDGSDLPLYMAEQEVQYVLEIGGGRAEELGIIVGGVVTVEPEIGFEDVS
jgi:uncharacterized membrane protein (UPF0127 family)